MASETTTNNSPDSEMLGSEVEPPSLASQLGPRLLGASLVKRLTNLAPLPIRATVAAAAFAMLVLVPYLGAVGLWDPWETHYGEVAREMIQRNDYVHPYWENAWFFSKPAFTMWMQAAGMQLLGTGIGEPDPAAFEPMSTASVVMRLLLFALLFAAGGYGLWVGRQKLKTMLPGVFWVGWALLPVVSLAIAHRVIGAAFRVGDAGRSLDVGQPDATGLYTEWGFRLPFVAFSVLAVALMTYALSRTVNARTGLASAFVLTTMPLYFLISRQAVTDTPIIAATICAMACALVAQLDTETKSRAGWWAAFYVFFSVGVLAKGLLGLMPAVLLAIYVAIMVVPWSMQAWQDVARWASEKAFTPFGSGVLVAAVVYVVVAALFGGYPNPIGHWVGLMPALGAFTITFMVLIGKAVAHDKTMPKLWAQLFEMKLGTGVLIFLLVAVPWYWRMFSFEQVDDESKLFWFRFLIHDHFSRLGAGVHTTTPGGTFTYFIEQGGYAMYPWVVLLPGAFAAAVWRMVKPVGKSDHVVVLVMLWFVANFALIGASATKFHHYVLPMLPPLAVLCGLYLDVLWKEGFKRWGHALTLGLPLLLLVGKDLVGNPKDFTDLFVYNYDRPYPFDMVQSPIAAWSSRPLWVSDLIAVAFLLIGAYLNFDPKTAKRSPIFRAVALWVAAVGLAAFVVSVSGGRTATPALWFGLAFAVPAGLMALEATRSKQYPHLYWSVGLAFGLPALGLIGKGASLLAKPGGEADPLLGLVGDVANIKEVWGFSFIVGGLLMAFIALSRSRTVFFSTGVALVTAWVLWFNWVHWVSLSHMWTQRDQFWRYYKQRKPDEPITAFLMNWRGETFYSRNTVKQIKDNNLLYQYAQQPGREFALVEHNRLGILKSAVGPDKTVTLIDKDVNNKFVLVTIE